MENSIYAHVPGTHVLVAMPRPSYHLGAFGILLLTAPILRFLSAGSLPDSHPDPVTLQEWGLCRMCTCVALRVCCVCAWEDIRTHASRATGHRALETHTVFQVCSHVLICCVCVCVYVVCVSFFGFMQRY